MSAAGIIVAPVGGTYTFPIWEGQVLPRTPQVDKWRRLGNTVDSAQTLGSMGPDSPITAYFLTSSDATAISFRQSVMQLPGQFVSITEPDGTSWTAALVLSCVARKKSGIRNYNGVSYTIAVICSLVINAQD